MTCNKRQLCNWTLFAKLACGVALAFMFAASASAAFTPTWSVAYDQTSSVTNQLRAVEIADQPGNNSVYVGMIQTTGGHRDVYQFNTSASLPLTFIHDSGPSNDQPKAIATDDRGNVYVGNRISGGLTGKITTFSSNLGSSTSTTTDVAFEQFGGLASAHFGGHYYLYATREARREHLRQVIRAMSGLKFDVISSTLQAARRLIPHLVRAACIRFRAQPVPRMATPPKRCAVLTSGAMARSSQRIATPARSFVSALISPV